MGGSSSSSSSRPSSVLGGVGGGSLGTVTEGSSARALNSETSAEEGSAPSAPEGIVSTSGQAPPSNASLPSTRRAGSAGGIVDYKV